MAKTNDIVFFGDSYTDDGAGAAGPATCDCHPSL